MQRVATRLREATKRTLNTTTYAHDGFNRADGAPGTADSGQSWTAGVFVISSNKLKVNSNTDGSLCVLSLTSGVNDVVISATVGGTGGQEGIVGRRTGTTYYLASFPTIGSATATLYKVVSGSFTSIGTAGYTSVAGDVLALSMKGTTIKVLKNSTALITVTDSAIASGTDCGFRHGNGQTTYTWDDFSVVAS